jgi:PAS domain S-box-containing protein
MGIDKDEKLSAPELHHHENNRLRTITSESHPFRTGPDAKRPVHESEVHSIESEMQNGELRQAQMAIELSRDMYAELYDFAPVGYFTFDSRGLIRNVNLTGAQLLGIERRQLADKPFSSLVADAGGREIFSKHLQRVLQQQGMQRCEIRLTGKDGAVIHGQVQSVKVDAPESTGGYIFSSIIDGTIGKQLGEVLQKAHDKLKSIVIERDRELTRTNVHLTREIEERKRVEASLRTALSEIKRMKDQLEAENIYLHQEVARKYNFGEIIGQNNALSNVCLQVEQVAPMNATVLLLGETGTGKGVVARAIHRSSARKDRSMITVDCTALPSNLIESELFGREKGAFTGADSRQIGRFELADGGTIFLDEIGEMPLELQSKLLRVIQDGEFERLGNPHTIKIDVRVIAATNRNLAEEIRNGRFREDLFYRINVFPITIPPLRQRKEDIPLLVNHFVSKFNKKIGKRIETVSKDTLSILQEYHWPGNVRELESVIERAVIISQGTALQVSDRFDTFRKTEKAEGQDVKAIDELENDHILQVLRKTGWRIEGEKGAAVLLGLNPSTLRARMRKHGISRQ